MTYTNNFDFFFFASEELANSLCLCLNSTSRCFLNKDITILPIFNWFMKQDGSIEGYTDAIWTGVTTLTLARAMESAIKENLTGLYNLVNNESINKFDLLGLFNKYFRNGKIIINSNDKL